MLQGVAANPPSVEAALLAANQDAALLGVSTYMVQNATGTAIQYWLGGESRFDASPRRRCAPLLADSAHITGCL